MPTAPRRAYERKRVRYSRSPVDPYYRSTSWRKLRARILLRDPLCTHCYKRSSVAVDHITARKAGGSDTPDNLRGLCQPCHALKTNRYDGGFGNRPRT